LIGVGGDILADPRLRPARPQAPAALNEGLGAKQYETKTRGVRPVAAVRPAAEGVYAIVRFGDHTHLAYGVDLALLRAGIG
jgi:hypothetical protein